MGGAYFAMGDFAKAESHLYRSYEGVKARKDQLQEHELILFAETLVRLLKLYSDQGNAVGVKRLSEEAAAFGFELPEN